MNFDIKTGDIELFNNKIKAFDNLNRIASLFPSLQFINDYQDITSYKIDNIITFNSYDFKIYLSFKSEILYKISIDLTDSSIKIIELEVGSFNDQLIFIKNLLNQFLVEVTKDATLLKKSKTQSFEWGYLAFGKPTAKWPFILFSYNYDKIKELVK